MTGKKEMLAQWVASYTRDLYAWAMAKTSDVALAEDLVQDTFLAAAESWGQFREQSRPRTWLFGILKNKIADHYRKQAARSFHGLPADDPASFFDLEGRWKKGTRPQPWPDTPDNLLDNPAFNDILRTCMENLPTLMHHCLQLTYLQEKKGREVCQELDISTTNYWQVMSRARLRLRACLEKHWFHSNS